MMCTVTQKHINKACRVHLHWRCYLLLVSCWS